MPWLQIIGALLLIGVGAAMGAAGMHKLDVRQIASLTDQLGTARRAAISEHAAREAVQQQCAAGDAAATLGADLADTARRAIARATQELDNATGDDSDPLRAQFERLREQAGPGTGGDPAAAPGSVDPLSRSP